MLTTLRHLPRDARDTLFVLAVIAWTILPHAAHLAPWCIALAGIILVARARLALAGGALPSRWTLAAVLALAVGLTLASESTLLGKEAGVTMLVVLMALKTLELRARRDAMVVFLLGFFIVLTHFLYSQSVLTALAMLVAVWGLLTALALAHMPVGQPSLAAAARVAARAALLGVPVMVALFVLFPRIAPLWGLPQDAGGRTGLSGTLSLGGVAEIANDESIALRVRFSGAVPASESMYFRGPVLADFDGREWRQRRGPPAFADVAESAAQLLGAPLAYEMTVEPSRLAMLPTLELTPDRPGAAPQLDGFNARARPEADWALDRPLAERVRVQAQAWPSHRLGAQASAPRLRADLELPPAASPRTRAWAAELRNRPELRDADAPALVEAVLAHIRSGGYDYTLAPGSYAGDAIDAFWLDRKQGFCEHFAASFVVVMRALDVPARIVTGYQGADPVPVDGWYVVRNSNAHAWAEVWIAGQGWMRVDPTAAVAPDRIRRGEGLPPRAGLVEGALRNVDPALAAGLRALWERMDNRWNQWVLNYSRRQQFDLLELLGVRAPDWRDLGVALGALLSAAALAAAGWALWDRQRQDPWQRLHQRIAERLAQLGVPVARHEPPRTRAARVRATIGPAGEPVARALERLDHLRYGPRAIARPDRRWWRQFDAEATRLHAARIPPVAG